MKYIRDILTSGNVCLKDKMSKIEFIFLHVCARKLKNPTLQGHRISENSVIVIFKAMYKTF